MKRVIFALAAAAALAAPFAAQAAPWQSVNQRQDALERRIDQGVRTGGGLSVSERRDLDQRFDRLNQRIYAQRNDHQRRY